MEEEKAQKRLGYFFAGINVISITVGILISYIIGLKEGITALIGSLIILTILAQSYGHRVLKD